MPALLGHPFKPSQLGEAEETQPLKHLEVSCAEQRGRETSFPHQGWRRLRKLLWHFKEKPMASAGNDQEKGTFPCSCFREHELAVAPLDELRVLG